MSLKLELVKRKRTGAIRRVKISSIGFGFIYQGWSLPLILFIIVSESLYYSDKLSSKCKWCFDGILSKSLQSRPY